MPSRADNAGELVSLVTPIDRLGLTPRQAAALRTMGLVNLGKLIAHLPMRHERHDAETPIKDLSPGRIVCARGEITATRPVMHGSRPRFEAVLHDQTGRLDLVWFNGLYMRERLSPGVRVRVQGKAQRRPGAAGYGLRIANPRTEIIRDEDEPDAREERIRPVYPASEACPSALIEKALARVLPRALPLIEDHLPEPFRRERALPELRDAYRMQHAPASDEEVGLSRRRLAYDELLLLQLGVHLKRAHLRRTLRSPALRVSPGIDRHIRERFPFTLTPGQDRAVAEIARDLSGPVPTNRLIQGDVGSGKTLVALYAMLLAVATGHQASLMAPTALLAEQHAAGIASILAGSRVRTELLTAGVTGDERARLLARLEAGEIDLLIGTHALLTEGVRFKSLAVAVIDEQHRFGVHQRMTLRQNATDHDATPHVLVMTATPIPRSLAITLLGDLDLTTIPGLPPGRTPIATRVVPTSQRDLVYTHVAQRLEAGDQAYIVLPAIDAQDRDTLVPAALPPPSGPESGPQSPVEGAGSEARPPLRDVRSTLAELQRGPLAGRRLAALHGQLPRSHRESVMERFRAGQIEALVATTVIEVGVDVPNATVIVVEQADRFGLSQLHQLRGRVGRGTKPGVCILIADPTTPTGEERLAALAATTDGFALAEEDLRLRGPGEVFGVRQAGAAPFKVADLARDRELLAMARRDAAAWIEASPALDRPADSLARRRLMKAFGATLGLADVG